MKISKTTTGTSRLIRLPALTLAAVALAGFWPQSIPAAEVTPLPDRQFDEQLHALRASANDTERLRQARGVLAEGWYSSQQIKTLARAIGNEDLRVEFAFAAYPRVVDPENFYDVYDAFTTFSKVFRLHDRLRNVVAAGPSQPVVPPVSNQDFQGILRAFEKEAFDDGKLRLAKQVLGGNPRLLSRQVRDIMKTFKFDDGRLAVAKLAYGRVLDPESFFVVNEAFAFDSTKDSLARYIESRAKPEAER
jgi:hypothetical protein